MEDNLTQILERKTEKFTLKASVSQDRMKLFVDIEPGANTLVIRDDILNLLKEVTHPDLIHRDVVENLVKEIRKGNKKIEPRRIAKGKEAEQGADGKVLLLVKKYTQQAEVKIDQKGFAKFGELHFFDNIRKGQAVARIYPPKAGIDGIDATGQVIPAPMGQPAKFDIDSASLVKKKPEDEGLDFELVCAEGDGYLKEEGGVFSIASELVIKGDVDYHTGNIDFVGSVRVSGSVRKGFIVRAERGISIEGAVDEGALYSSGGEISVAGMFVGGQGTGLVVGAEDVSVGLADNIQIESRGRIIIKKEAVGCTLRSGSTIELPEGSLLGGQCFAVCGVEAKEIGNPAGRATMIQLCSSVEATTDYALLAADIAGHDKALKLIALHLGPYLLFHERIRLLNEPLRSKFEALYKKHKAIEESRIKLLFKKKEMLSISKMNHVLRVNFKKAIYAGVEIWVGEQFYKILDPIDGPKSIDFSHESKSFSVGEYKALECSVNPPKAPSEPQPQ